ncbi:MAG: hypothetical protein KC493_01010 [Bacteriovoracaceae bacterium]|nr:hypothetical protein [Bacteriovoracaceae bacterium]
MKYFHHEKEESELAEINKELRSILGENEVSELLRGVEDGLRVLEKLGIEPSK